MTARVFLSSCGALIVALGALSSSEPARAAGAKAPPGAPDGVSPKTGGDLVAAYQGALARARLAPTASLSRQRLREELSAAETMLAEDRHRDAIGRLVAVVESPRFQAFARTDEGQNARYLLGAALAQAGAEGPARGYLVPLLAGDVKGLWTRRAVRSLVELGLESDHPDGIAKDLAPVTSKLPAELAGDVAYLRGRAAERGGHPGAAQKAYGQVSERSRYWAQAVYLSALLDVDGGRQKAAEQKLCRVADAKQTPKFAPIFGGSDFFKVRDLARLALGRIAHEQYRFDDARYYYYLVPEDSKHLPEALYEAATTRYEAKDYEGARALMVQLKALNRHHPYEDEAYLLSAYIDLARCKFAAADVRLKRFLKRYEPVRNAARALSRDRDGLRRFMDAVLAGRDPASAGLRGRERHVRALGALVRVDAGYRRGAARLLQLEVELGGLRAARRELEAARARVGKQKGHRDDGPLEGRPEKLEAAKAQLAELRRLLRQAQARKKKGVAALERQLKALEVRRRALQLDAATATDHDGGSRAGVGKGATIEKLLDADVRRLTSLERRARGLRRKAAADQLKRGRAALTRIDRRLSRLLRRARLGRIETVLGRKRALEVEIEALSQGLLPRGIVDSLDAERYLRDDEEYWPADGEDWADEYVGGEGLR